MSERPKYEVAALSARDMFVKCADESAWMKEIGFAMQILRANDILQKCDSDSIRNAVVNVALCGATLNPALAQAYLVPRDGKCCLDFSYRGLLKIATDSGGVKSIQAAVVYDFDDFDFEEGSTPFIHYKRNLNPPEDFRKDPLAGFWKHFTCAFSIATLQDGCKDYMILPKWRVEKIKNTSKARSDKAPWGQWPEEMVRKTVIKYHYKTLPQTDRMSNAVTILNEHEGLDTSKAAIGGGSAAKDIMSRFGFRDEPEDAEIVPQNDGPDLCPSCQKLRVMGKCHNSACDLGEPPPGE